MFRFFGSKRYFNLFFEINGKNIIHLSKKHGTVSHLSTVTDQLVREGLITKEQKGREVEILLTDEGKEFLEIIRKFDDFAVAQLKKIKSREVTNGK